MISLIVCWQDFLSKFSIFSFAYFLTAFSGDTLYSTSLGTSRVSRNDIAWYRTSEARSYAEQAQGISNVSCNLGWEDKPFWCLRKLELTASSSALFLLLRLLQTSAVAFTTVMYWKNPVFWDCCSGCMSVFWALLFPEEREGYSSSPPPPRSWEGYTMWRRKERKAVSFTEGGGGGLKAHSCRTEGRLKWSEEFDEGGRGAVERRISGVK